MTGPEPARGPYPFRNHRSIEQIDAEEGRHFPDAGNMVPPRPASAPLKFRILAALAALCWLALGVLAWSLTQ